MIRTLRIFARIAFFAVVISAVVGGTVAGVTLAYFSRDLPDDQQLLHYTPAIGSKIYAADGSVMLELASERRIFVPLGKIPPLVVHAFLAAEDRDFYKHNGVNPSAVFRAAMADLLRMQKGQRPLGASTITQQVVRHFFLTNEVSVTRKIKEALLAYRIEKVLSKDQILEIYLNEIYLGAGAYGVAAAADTYFSKPLDQLTPAEAALLAALPKAPQNYNPIRNPVRAKERRDWVLSGMAEVGFLPQNKAKTAMAQPLGLKVQPPAPDQNGYFAEEVRRELVARFGDKGVYEGGLTVRTSYAPEYQKMAERAFRDGLVAYDRRHGWRGAVTHLASAAEAEKALAETPAYPGIPTWRLAAVTGIDREGARIVLKGGGDGRIPYSQLGWARYGHHPVTVGDLIYVEPVGQAATTGTKSRHQKPAPAVELYGVRQIPELSGGFVALDPKTGRVAAIVGGWDFRQSAFDRATQAMRQPGSAIKPLVYVTAMDHGFTPDSIVDDAPLEVSQGPGLPPWRPVNYEGNAVGPDTLRDALIHSRNLVTARLAIMLGMPTIAKTVENFDVMDRMPLYYSMALGAGETTVMRLTAAYAMLDNGGHWLLPSVIDTVQDRNGRIVYQKGVSDCGSCFIAAAPAKDDAGNASSLFRVDGAPKPGDLPIANAQYADGLVVYRPTKPDPLVSPTADAEIVSMMQGVVQQGTGIEVAAVGKPIAGKTGTTSDWKDAWFVGFAPSLAAGVYVGFDEPRTLGHGEVGGKVSAPIFRDFMMAALKDVPATPFEPPAGAQVALANASAAGSNDAAHQGYPEQADNPDDSPYAAAPSRWDSAEQRAVPDMATRSSRQPPPLPWQAIDRAYAAENPDVYPAQQQPYPPGTRGQYGADYTRPPQQYGSTAANRYVDTGEEPYTAQPSPSRRPKPYGDTESGGYGQRPQQRWQSPPPRQREEAGAYPYPYAAPRYWPPAAQYARDPTPQYGTVMPPGYWQYGPNPGGGRPY